MVPLLFYAFPFFFLLFRLSRCPRTFDGKGWHIRISGCKGTNIFLIHPNKSMKIMLLDVFLWLIYIFKVEKMLITTC